MGVTVREKPKGSGVWWVFVNFKSQRRAKLVGSGPRNKRVAEDLATKIKARLLDGNVADLEAVRPEPTKAVTFADVAHSWSGWYPSLYPTRFNTRRNSESVIRAH